MAEDNEAVFPGENLFLYWKTSASLWKSKIELYPHYHLLVPVNWAHHSDTGESIDFAKQKPETDLKKICDIAESLGKKVSLLVPLSPVPFFVNGGVPSLLSRGVMSDFTGKTQCVVDPEENLIKLYSFFDPRIFGAFSFFVGELGKYISQSGISCDVFGLEAGFFGKKSFRDFKMFQSYLQDFSQSYHKSFSRFISKKKADGDLNQGDSSVQVGDEKKLHREFFESIRSLYIDSAREALSANWEGILSLAALGGSSEDFFSRLYGQDSSVKYLQDILQSLTQNIIPSAAILPSRLKKGDLSFALKTLVNDDYTSFLMSSNYTEESFSTYKPLCFFKVYSLPEGDELWERLGLWNFLHKNYRWSYKNTDIDNFMWSESVSDQNILFLQGEAVDENIFKNILKIFMSGGRVVLNRSGLALKFLKKLETFFLENSLEVEKVFFKTPLHSVVLGEGQLLIFEGSRLDRLDKSDLSEFWERILSTFNIRHVQVEADEGIEFFWRMRMTSPSELNYEEVRRVNLFNLSSYRKKAIINFPKSFALMKVGDKVNAQVETGPHQVHLDFLPGAMAGIDFGVFHE